MSDTEKKEGLDFNNVSNGPLDQSERQCRDIFCCMLFLANIVGMIYVTFHAYLDGNPTNLYRGIANNVVCGEVGGVAENYPYVYFYNPIYSTDQRVCVKTCPTFTSGSLSTVSCYAGHGVTCSYDVTFSSDGSVSVSTSAMNTTNYFIGYETSMAMDRICLPSSAVLAGGLATVATSMTSAVQTTSFANLVTDTQNNWQWLLCGIGMTVVISLVFMFLLRCLVGCIVWVSCIGIVLVFAGLGLIFIYNGGVLSGTAASYAGFLGMPTLSGSDYYATYGYICFGLSGVFLILLLCCCNRLRLAVAVCKVAGRFVIRVCLVTLVPIILSLILIAMWACCLLCMIYLLSVATFTISSSTDLFTSVASYTDSSLYELYYFLFATLWCNAIIGAIGVFVIASACCLWYYNQGPNDQLDSPILRSFKLAFRYHFGSLAFGSFILALVQFMQILVEIFKKQAESTGADENKCFQILINCLRCCLACVERIVQFINKTAYIQIALRGKNFCMAAKDGFETVWSNGMRYLIVAGVGEIMMFMGKVMISVGGTAAFYCLITFVAQIKQNIVEPLYLLLIMFIVSYGIAHLFMGVYSIAMDTVLACFIVDEMNQEAAGGKKALHAPEELYDLLPQQ